MEGRDPFAAPPKMPKPKKGKMDYNEIKDLVYGDAKQAVNPYLLNANVRWEQE